jgi:hypothetical protein
MEKLKYNCEKCYYNTDKKSNFTKHCKTKKHIENSTLPIPVDKRPKSVDGLPKLVERKYAQNNKFKCEYCENIFVKSTRSRHYSRCKAKKETQVSSEIEKLKELTSKLQEKLDQKEELFKEQIKEKDVILEKRIQDMEKEMFDFMKTMVITNKTTINNNTTNNNNNTNYNMYYIINNFTEAENIEDIMAAPFTQEELDYIEENGSVLGSYKVIKDRCINDKDLSKRPVHCTDLTRKKYLLRHNNEWIIDPKADKLLSMTFDKMKDAYDTESDDIYEKINNTQQLIKLDIDGRKILNKQISKDVLLRNNV